jgi:hypothetical protein
MRILAPANAERKAIRHRVDVASGTLKRRPGAICSTATLAGGSERTFSALEARSPERAYLPRRRARRMALTERITPGSSSDGRSSPNEGSGPLGTRRPSGCSTSPAGAFVAGFAESVSSDIVVEFSRAHRLDSVIVSGTLTITSNEPVRSAALIARHRLAPAITASRRTMSRSATSSSVSPLESS